MVAVASLRDALDLPSIMNEDISKLVNGLVKSGTSMPMVRSKVMPIQPFMQMFSSWKGNWQLTLEELRLKCITLLAFAVMLRPSDIAPNATVVNDKGEHEQLVMTTDQLRFENDGSCVITFHGIKNDYSRDGFEVVLQPSRMPRLDRVVTLKCYTECTKYVRPMDKALFLALKKPFGPITSKTVSRILEKAIVLVGLGGNGYSAKSFCPTAATMAVDAGFSAQSICKVGRWRSQDVFQQHYVHSRPDFSFTDKVFKLQE